jgi:probable F420-dependent oxidoreductase
LNAPRTILLTGATGSLGGHILAALLAETTATVHCLVRSADSTDASRRIGHRLARLDEPLAWPTGRLIALPGDLEQPRFGLSPRMFDALAETIDTTVNCAANVDLAASYEQLAPANVAAVRTVIALARRRAALTGRPAAIHQVSTMGVLLAAPHTGLTEADENTPASAATSGPLGYPRSKAEAEAELRRAADEFAIPLTMYRPAVVTGHSRSGRTSSSDMLTPLLWAATAVGAIPQGTPALPLERVDVVARALVRLMYREDAAGRVFHLIHPRPLPPEELFAALQRAGHRLESLPATEWWRLLEKHADDPAVRPLLAMTEMARYMLSLDADHRPATFGCEATWAALADSGFAPTAIGADFLDRLITHLALPAPRLNVPTAQPRALRIDGLLHPERFRHEDQFPDGVAAALACRRAGYGMLWAQEQNHDPLLALAAAATVSTIPLGTSVTIALARTPMTVAHAAHDLQAATGGQFILGLGSQLPVSLKHHYSMPGDQILSRMREFIEALRAIWASWNEGRPLAHRGRHYNHSFANPYSAPPPSPYGPPPVYLAASGPRMAELAGEVAAGLIAPPFADRHLLADVLLPALQRGLDRSHRSRSDISVVAIPLLVCGRSPAEFQHVADRTRAQIALFCSTRAYRPTFAAHGLGHVADQLADLSLSSVPDRFERMADLVDDSVLKVFATVSDTPARMGTTLLSKYAGLADRIIVPAPHGPEAGLWDPHFLGLRAADPGLPDR